MSSLITEKEKRYVGVRETALYGVANGGQVIGYNLIRMQLTFFYVTVFGIPAKAVTAMIFFMGIWDALNDPLMGSIVDRSYRPHVNCVKMTRDNKYLLAADLGMDHVKVYELDHNTGKLKLVDIIHSEQYSGPRHIKVSKDGQFIYIVHEDDGKKPAFEKIQTISTLNDYHAGDAAASGINLSWDYNYLICTNAGDNSVCIFHIDKKTGMLEKIFCLPISGSYPKDAMMFPDNKHLVSLNHENNTMTFFAVDLKQGTIVMNAKEIKIMQPNCIVFHRLEQEETAE